MFVLSPSFFYVSLLQGGLSSSDESCDNFGRNSDSDSDAGGIRTDGGIGERDPLDRRETLVCDRLRIVTNALTVLVQSRMAGRFLEKLVSSATRVFRAITKVCVWDGAGESMKYFCVVLCCVMSCRVVFLCCACFLVVVPGRPIQSYEYTRIGHC